jgi:DnaK suppressor protein
MNDSEKKIKGRGLRRCKMRAWDAAKGQVMNAKDLQRYKRLLLAKLDELSVTHADAAPPAPGAGGPMGDLADQANADAEAELHIRVHQGDARFLRAIEDALARIIQETFGVCEVCKLPISKARLEAVPWTRLCRECKEREQSTA